MDDRQTHQRPRYYNFEHVISFTTLTSTQTEQNIHGADCLLFWWKIKRDNKPATWLSGHCSCLLYHLLSKSKIQFTEEKKCCENITGAVQYGHNDVEWGHLISALYVIDVKCYSKQPPGGGKGPYGLPTSGRKYSARKPPIYKRKRPRTDFVAGSPLGLTLMWGRWCDDTGR